jgi:hypothetical protein
MRRTRNTVRQFGFRIDYHHCEHLRGEAGCLRQGALEMHSPEVSAFEIRRYEGGIFKMRLYEEGAFEMRL